MEGILFFMFSFVSLSLLIAGLFATIFRKELIVSSRIKAEFGSLKNVPSESRHTGRLGSQFKRTWNKYQQKVSDKTPRYIEKELEKRLQDAGNPFNLHPIAFRMIQFILAIVMFVVVLLIFGPGTSNLLMIAIASSAAGLLGIRYPEFYLSIRKKKRVQAIQKDMPDFFDMLNLTIEAGLGIDAAIYEVSNKLGGPISEEFIRTMEDMKLGKSRKEAFDQLRNRVPSEQFQSVLTALIQADQLGIGMSKVLRKLTIRIREKRREAAREQAMKTPVKMLFPMVFFIFPSIFIVLLGPLVIYFIMNGLN